MATDTDIEASEATSEEFNAASTPSVLIRSTLADAFTFIRSMETNQAFAAVTLEQLIGDQIIRNGESDRSSKAQYDPYSYNPEKSGGEPASNEPPTRANFLGGADTQRATKLDRVLSVKSALSKVIEDIKKAEPVDVADPEEYTDALENSSGSAEA